MFRCDCGEGVFNTVAQIGHDCSELSCSKRFPSNLRRCNHGIVCFGRSIYYKAI